MWETKVLKELREEIEVNEREGVDGRGEKTLKTKNSIGVKSSEESQKGKGV